MTANARPHLDALPPTAPPTPAWLRGWLVPALLGLLLGAGCNRSVPTGTTDRNQKEKDSSSTQPQEKRPTCSDDGDPKYLAPLEFGEPLETAFDPARLDALKDRPLPAIEVYPWQPKELVAVLGEHRMRGRLLAASPDGKLLALGSPGDAYVRLGPVDTVHEKEKAIFACPGGPLVLLWAPGGEAIAISCGDGLVRLYDVRDLDKIPEPLLLDKPKALVTSLSYSGDGKYLLGGDNRADQGRGWVWDVATRKVVQELVHTGPVMGVSFSPVMGDYRALISGGPQDGKLHLWDAVAGKEEKEAIDFRQSPVKLDRTSYVGQVAISPDGKWGLSSHYKRDSGTNVATFTVRVWDLGRFEKGKELHTIGGHDNTGPLLAFSPDSRSFAAARFSDGGVWLWDVQKGAQVRRLAGTGGIWALRFLGTGDRLAFTGTVSNDANVHVHEVETGKELRPPVGHLAGVACVAVAPDGRRVASGGDDLLVRLWDLETLTEPPAIQAGQTWSVGFHPDARQVYYCGSSHATLPFIDVESGKVRTPTYDKAHSGPIQSAAITRDGRYALTGGHQDGTVRLWHLKDGRQVRYFEFGPNPGPAAVSLSPDMRRALRYGNGPTRLLHLRCQEVKHEWPAVPWPTFLPDAQAAFCGGATTPVWKVKGDSPKETEPLKVSLAGIASGSFSADAKRVAGLFGGKAAVYEVGSARLLWEWTPPPHFGGLRGVALAADGRHLLTANGDGTAYVVRLP